MHRIARVVGAGPLLIGRDAELAQLRELVAHAHAGHGAFATVTGPAGIGKSALMATLRDLIAHDAARTITVIEEFRRGELPLATWSRVVEILLSQRREAPVENGPPAGDSSTATLASLDPATAPDLAAAGDRVLDALDAAGAPVVLLLDEFHLADDPSRLLLRRLQEELPVSRTLVLAAVRQPVSEQAPNAVHLPIPDHEIALTGLRSVDLRTLLCLRLPELGPDERDRRVCLLAASTGGNPLRVLAELVTTSPPEDAAHGSDAIERAIDRLTPDELRALTLLAIAGDHEPNDVARHAGLTPEVLGRALQLAGEVGLTRGGEGRAGRRLHPWVIDLLERRLDAGERARLHLALARSLRQDRTVSATEVARHLLAARPLAEPVEVLTCALDAGLEALDRFAYEEADRLLAIAQEAAVPATDDETHLRVLLARARARQRLGDLDGTSLHAAAAARLAQRRGDVDLLAEAAVLHAYPPDWRRSSPTARALLAAADADPGTPAWRARVAASRSIVEMRIPTAIDEQDEEWAWQTRPSVARPISVRALQLARSSGDARALVESLLAWRSNHRSPRFHSLRHSATAEALAVAQRLGDLTLVFEAALRHGLDALESGDRDTFDGLRTTMAWAAERSHERRLLWRCAVAEAMSAGMDGDLDRLAAHRERAAALGVDQQFDGRTVAQTALHAYEHLQRGQLTAFGPQVRLDHPVLQHPIGLAVMARVAALTGREDLARELLATLRERPRDEESSLLMTATEAGITALALGDAETGAWALDVLDPWTDLCSFDSEGLWPALPVALVTRDLRALAGDLEGTRRDHATAREIAGRLRSRPALEALRGTLASRGPLVSGRPDGIELTARQVAVLQRVASGMTNEQIASELHLSRATVVREIGTIYRTLGAANRAEAVRRASAVGLLLD